MWFGMFQNPKKFSKEGRKIEIYTDLPQKNIPIAQCRAEEDNHYDVRKLFGVFFSFFQVL